MSDDVLDLLERVPAPAMAIDPYAAVLGGRRRLRRRRAGFTVAGVAAAAVIVAVVTQLPAVNRAAPLPAVSSTGGATGAPTASAAFDFGGTRYVVRPIPQPGDPTHVSFVELAPDGSESVLGGLSLQALGEEPFYAHADGGDVIIGVLPAAAESVSAFFGPDALDAVETRRVPLPGTAYSAFAIRVAAPLTADDLWFLDWSDSTGRSRATAAADTRTAVFTVPSTDDAVTVWGERVTRTWGLAQGGFVYTSEPAYDGRPLVRYVGTGPADPAGWWAAYGLLPAGARDVEVTLAPGVDVVDGVAYQALEDLDATAFFVQLRTPGDGMLGGVVTRVTWTNADGTPGSFTPGG